MRYFEQSFEKLRGNRFVDYRQLGFKYQLYSCEVCIVYTESLAEISYSLVQKIGYFACILLIFAKISVLANFSFSDQW